MESITREVFKHHSITREDPAFSAFWDLGMELVRIPDENASREDLEGDCYTPAFHPSIPADQILKERAAFRRKVTAEGVWGMGLAKGSKPDYSTFIWGFVGWDMIGSDYDKDLIDMMREAAQRTERNEHA